jgi:hypothetical protein
MSKLSPHTRALFDAARDTDDPVEGDAARVRLKLAARIGAGVAVGGAASTVAGGTAVAAVKPAAALGFKLLFGVLMTAAVGGVAYVTIADRSATSAPAPPSAPAATHAPAPSVAEMPGPSEGPGAANDETETPAAEGLDDRASDLGDGAAPEVAPAVPIVSPPGAPASASGPGDGIADETALLDKAQTALREGRPDAALSALDEHGTQYGDGVLREERIGARILVLCRLGRVAEARAEAARFLQESPRSPVAARVRSSCAAP